MLLYPIPTGHAETNNFEVYMPTYDAEKMKEQLVLHEGVRDSVYYDSRGYATIGIGHLIDSRKGGKISESVIKHIYDEDVAEKEKDLDRYLPWWRNLDAVRQRVLLDMCFNLGIFGLLNFHRTLGFIENGKYEEAASAMLESLWASQVGVRATRLSKMMATGNEQI
jgi:lysozyme